MSDHSLSSFKIRCLLMATLLCLVFSHRAPAQDIVLDRIRAVVNEGVVLQSELDAAVRFFQIQAASSGQSVPSQALIEERLLEELINREIRRQHARQLGVSIDAGSINQAVENIAGSNNMDTLRFRETLRQQGLDYNLFRNNIEQELLLQRLIERDVARSVRVSAQEIDDYVTAAQNEASEQQRYRLRHILIAVPPSADAATLTQAQQRAQSILSSLRNGDDFAQVAIAESDGARALQGGDLGWRNLQELPDFLSEAIRNQPVGALLGPLRSSNGLHIVTITDQQASNLTIRSETLARHIYLAGAEAGAEQTLQNIRADILSGADFADLAARFSQDPNSADRGGELPWFSEGQLPAQLEQAANNLPVGQVSPPFRTQFGWHILEVLERRERDVGLEALREQAAIALRQNKIEQEAQRWSRQLRDEAFIDIRS